MMLFLHKSQSTLQKDSIIISTSHAVKLRHEERKQQHWGYPAGPRTEADRLSSRPVLSLRLVRLSLHVLKLFLKCIKKAGTDYAAKCVFFLFSLSID